MRVGGRLARHVADTAFGPDDAERPTAIARPATAKGELTGLDIDPSIFDPNEKEVVEDLILAAIKDAQVKASERSSQEMQKITEELGLPAGMGNPFGGMGG